MADLERLVDVLAATAEVCGAEVKPAALVLMAEDLIGYPVEQIDGALARMRRELKGRFTLQAILERMEDGRPEADEAWAMAIAAQDEAQTVVWTEEMAASFGQARPLLDDGDKVGARMAFRQTYERLVIENRAQKLPASWNVSLGWDTDLREQAILGAVDAKRLTHDAANRFLPAPKDGGPIVGLITGKTDTSSLPKPIQERCAELRKMLVEGKAAAERERSAKVAAQRKAEEARKKQAVESLEQWAQQKGSA